MRSLLFSPSLTRRVFFALIGAFLLVAGVLVLKDVYDFNAYMGGDGYVKEGQHLIVLLQGITEHDEAIRTVKAVELLFNKSLKENKFLDETDPKYMFFQLAKPSGEILYETTPSGVLLQGKNNQVTKSNIQGQDYWLYSSDSERWVVRQARPQVSKMRFFRLSLLGLIPQLLLSFPFVFIPLWLAIRQGLQPLSRLSEKLAARGEDDLSPLAVDTKYAELDQVTKAIENMLVRLRSKIENERVFIQDAAHELRTPLAVISAQAHVLLHASGSKNRELAEFSLCEAIQRASHLSAQLLSLASLDNGGVLERQSVDIAVLLQELLAHMAQAAFARQIDLALEAPDHLCHYLNKAAFVSIVQNLLDNALRYGNNGGNVVVSLIEETEAIVLRVADDGPGIDPHERERVFERFYRGKGHDATGTGLGLAIVRKVVRVMGGTIFIEDGLDSKGVSFVIRISKQPN